MSELSQEISEMRRHAGLVHKLLCAADKAGLEPHDLNYLAENEARLRQLYGVMRGFMEMKPVEFRIDCDNMPEWEWCGGVNWILTKHQKQGQVVLTRVDDDLYINGRRIDFHFFETKPVDGRVDGVKLEAELEGKHVLNASVMLFLRQKQQLIPESWRWIGNRKSESGKSLSIYFWGTEIRNANEPCVPQMYCTNPPRGFWEFSPGWVGKYEYTPGVAAVLEAA